MPLSTGRRQHRRAPTGPQPRFDYPESSPLVTSVGGTELAINGSIPPAGAPVGGTITDEVVWNQDFPPGMFYAGGGGPSKLFTAADAPWQRAIGLSGQENKPDIAALAGSPQLLYGGIGTSGSSPLMAGAIAVLDGYLAGHDAKSTGPPNPTVYRIARDASVSAQVFHDVVHGTNDLLGLGCCSAKPDYDQARGLGSLDMAGLAAELLAEPSLRVPWTTLKLTAFPANSTGVPETIEAVTNNVLVGTPYFVNIYVEGKLLEKGYRTPLV